MRHLAKVKARLLLLCTRCLAFSVGNLCQINRRLSLVFCKARIKAHTQLRSELLGLKVFVTRFEKVYIAFARYQTVLHFIIEALIVDMRPKLAKICEICAI